MSEREPQTWTGLKLEARHVPEEHDPTKPYPHDTNDPVTGFVDVGTMIDGVFVVILRRKAPGLFADIARVKEAGYTAPSAPPQLSDKPSEDIVNLHMRINELQAQIDQSQQAQIDQSQQPPQPPSE